ncbi:hypothetical protein [Methanococcus maripaludis]|uniref:Uncharacterized protein n=2 Tax=Methanococcus maripaludis TaxID=39152 RepID=A0A7J9PJG6_METMI|nr:hypothetical protein [Methanococcus maripaludis]MBA2862924.1 hypothetical protein [Methanococcus maripaludis]
MNFESKNTDIEFNMSKRVFFKCIKYVLMIIGIYGVLSLLKVIYFNENIAIGIFGVGVIGSRIYGDYQERKYRKKHGLWYSKVRVNYSDGNSEEMDLLERIDDSLLVDKLVHAGNKGLSVSVEVIK